ncbi:disulfide bond formation protein DsbA [bacterium]|nr:disulfide bond formation protein DsbA [bacterium]
MKNHWIKFIGILVVVAIASSIVIANKAGKKANEDVVLEDSHIKGDTDADIVLVEYSDFQCPACAVAYFEVKDLMEEHGAQVSFEYRHFPLVSIHPNAVPGAIAAEAAGVQGKFWEMHDKLFENQTAWSKGSSPQAFFIQYAEDIGLDVDMFRRHLESSIIREKVEAQFNEARELGLTGTPSFFLNGEQMQFSSYEDWKNQIESLLQPEFDVIDGE